MANKDAQIVKSLYARNLDRSQAGWPESYAIDTSEHGIDWSSSDLYFADIIGGGPKGQTNEYFNAVSPLGDVDFTFVGSEKKNEARQKQSTRHWHSGNT